MKDPAVRELVNELKLHVAAVNVIMQGLGKLDVEVRVAYNDKKGDVQQSINLWKITEHTDYLDAPVTLDTF
jgi:hypothetical protein